MRTWNEHLLLAVAVGLCLLVAACGVDSPQGGLAGEPTNVGSDDWGPMAVVDEHAGNGELVAGTLEVTSGCVILDERGHQRLVMAWPSDLSSWIEESGAIGFDSSTGERLVLQDQYRVSITGTRVAEQASLDWVNAPRPDCVSGGVFLVSDVTDVVIPPEDLAASDGPIGGGLSSATGTEAQLECPTDVEAATEEWYGPAGLTLDGAVAEAFGDLLVGWIGEPFEMESTDEWSSWGLQDDEGNLVAVATVVASNGGWDPSHARYCVIPQPTPPPPPFTLYVSNQSFEDPTVGITITIDDQIVVDEDFEVEGQHNWIAFTPDVDPGDHTLEAVSDKGAEFRVDFTLPAGEPRWAVVDYWFYPDEGPRRFTFNISDEPLAFG